MSRDVASIYRDMRIRDEAVKAYDEIADDLAALGNEMLEVGARDIAETCMDAATLARRASRAEHMDPKPAGLP